MNTQQNNKIISNQMNPFQKKENDNLNKESRTLTLKNAKMI